MLQYNAQEYYEDESTVDAEDEFYNVPDKRIIDMLAEVCVDPE